MTNCALPGRHDIERLIETALAEDLGERGKEGDCTSQATIPEKTPLKVSLVTREDIVPAGLQIALEVFRRLSPASHQKALVRDGEKTLAGTVLASISGDARGLLTAERTALNILQHLSGIATLTRTFVEEVAGTGVVILDTRKTTPGLRRFEKYAVAVGSGHNHRMGLYDGVLIKDNHIAACGSIDQAIASAKKKGLSGIEVECDTLDQVEKSLAAGADRILLDNMDNDTLRAAVTMVAGRIPLEASGGVTIETVRAIAETGVNFISIGRLTQSAPAVDIGLDISFSHEDSA